MLIEKLDEYQELAKRTNNESLSDRDQILTCALGLGEAGEVQNLLKKHYFHGHSMDLNKIVDELGDVLWYVAVMSSLLGFDLSDIAEYNIKKLKLRYPEGFSEDASINRPEE